MSKTLLPIPPELSDYDKNIARDWREDPCYDLREANGSDREAMLVLADFQDRQQVAWDADANRDLERLAQTLGCPDNLALARYIQMLENRIEVLSTEIEEGLDHVTRRLTGRLP